MEMENQGLDAVELGQCYDVYYWHWTWLVNILKSISMEHNSLVGTWF